MELPILFMLFGYCFNNVISTVLSEEEIGSGFGRYSIEGRVFPPDELEHTNWQVDTRIHINGGEYIGFVRDDGSFVVHNVPSGSYVLEVLHPDYLYEPLRVEINSKGKHRARKLNYVLTSQVIQVGYPLRLKAMSKIRYFQVREQWRITDFLFSPMTLMFVFPLLLIMVLPKLMNDPETKEDLKQISNMANMAELPEMSTMFTNLFNGGAVNKAKAKKENKKKQ